MIHTLAMYGVHCTVKYTLNRPVSDNCLIHLSILSSFHACKFLGIFHLRIFLYLLWMCSNQFETIFACEHSLHFSRHFYSREQARNSKAAPMKQKIWLKLSLESFLIPLFLLHCSFLKFRSK